MKRAIFFLIPFLLMLAGCIPFNEQNIASKKVLPEVVITLAMEGDHPITDLLRDDAYRQALGDANGIHITLQELSKINDLKENADVSFNDALITDYTIWLVPLSDDGLIRQLADSLNMAEPQYGRNGGRQYGYVFSDSKRTPESPQLVVNREMLSSAQLRRVEYSPDGFYVMLETLSEQVRTPLAVYGCPAEEGFGALLGLFGLTPLGGHEFYLKDNAIQFDKLGSRAEEYLSYVRTLYSQKLIPSDCLSLNAYSCRIMFANKRCAMAMVPDEEAATALIQYAEEYGIDAAVVKLPVAEGLLETDVYGRTIGMIAKRTDYANELSAVFEQLQSDAEKSSNQSNAEAKVERLFYARSISTVNDPIIDVLSDMRLLYEKHLMDVEIIKPYYSQLAVGVLEPHHFETMYMDWFNEYDINRDSIDNNLSGRRLLQVFYGWSGRS